ncbi:hypothetical protein Tco_1313093 [Tanacetum coccineum]
MLVWGEADSETLSKLEYKFQDKENSEDIFSFGSAMEDFICVVFVPDRNILLTDDSGQPGLDELEFDDLYTNMKGNEHELKGFSNSNSQNLASQSTEVKASTLKQRSLIDHHISQKDILRMPQARRPVVKLMKMLMEEIDIAMSSGYDNCKEKEFMRKNRRPFDLNQNGINF